MAMTRLSKLRFLKLFPILSNRKNKWHSTYSNQEQWPIIFLINAQYFWDLLSISEIWKKIFATYLELNTSNSKPKFNTSNQILTGRCLCLSFEINKTYCICYRLLSSLPIEPLVPCSSTKEGNQHFERDRNLRSFS